MAETHRGPGRPPFTDEGYHSRISIRLPSSDIAVLNVLTHSVSTFIRESISERLEKIKHDSHAKRAAAPGGS